MRSFAALLVACAAAAPLASSPPESPTTELERPSVGEYVARALSEFPVGTPRSLVERWLTAQGIAYRYRALDPEQVLRGPVALVLSGEAEVSLEFDRSGRLVRHPDTRAK